MKPTKPNLQTILFTSLIICSISCFVFMSSVQNEQLNTATIPNDKIEEVVFPDVFAIKDFVEKIMKHLPAS